MGSNPSEDNIFLFY